MRLFPVRARLALLVAAALIALTACNPLTMRINELGHASTVYSGPPGAWVEVSVAGFEGLTASYQIVLASYSGQQRLCRDSETGEVEDCRHDWIFFFADSFFVTSTVFRPVLSPVDGDAILVFIGCSLDDVPVECPGVTVRVVDEDGQLVGDLLWSQST